MALALYRKYRSATFADVIGQEHVTAPLQQALAAGRINHAYLFSGPRGCGKTSSARILARSLNCAKGPTPTPCGECESCRELAPNGTGSIDVIEIDAASHGGVDDARDLRERAFFAPVRDRYKVYIIDEAHMVTTQGFNALLKLIEEPPEFLVFVFATTEPDKVLQTIRSRTHHYPFRLIPPGIMRAHLERICAAEGVTVEPSVVPLVVRAGGGSARDSLSLLDQLLAGAGPEGVTYARAVGLLGVTDGALLDDMVDALAAGDAAAVYGTVDRVVEAGHDPRRFAADLLDRFRDLIVLDAVPDAGTRGLIDAPADELAHMTDEAGRLGGATLTRYAEIVHTALIEMRGTTSPRLVLELLCARMQLPDASTDSAALLQRVERIERRLLPAGAASASAPEPRAAPAPEPRAPAAAPARPAGRSAATRAAAPQPPAAQPRTAQPPAPQPPAERRPTGAAQPSAIAKLAGAAQPTPAQPTPAQPTPAADVSPPASGVLDATGLRRQWPDVLEEIKKASKTIWAMLDGSQVTGLAGDTVTLEVAPSLAKRLGEDRNSAVIAGAVVAVFGGSWRMAVVPAGSSAAAAPARPAAPTATEPAPSAAPVEDDPRDEFDPGDARGDAPKTDPESDALRLLEATLGARPVDEP